MIKEHRNWKWSAQHIAKLDTSQMLSDILTSFTFLNFRLNKKIKTETKCTHYDPKNLFIYFIRYIRIVV